MRTWKDLKKFSGNRFKLSISNVFFYSVQDITPSKKVKKGFNKFMEEWSVCGRQTSHSRYEFQL